MIVYNLTCNVDLEVEKQWVEWVDLQLGQMSKSDRINNTYLLKLNSNSPSKGSIYALQYLISNQETLQNFLKNEGLEAINYPEPIVDYKLSRQEAKEMFS